MSAIFATLRPPSPRMGHYQYGAAMAGIRLSAAVVSLSSPGVPGQLPGPYWTSVRSDVVALETFQGECFNVGMSPTPRTDTHENATARTARQRRDAADRAREHRERQRAELEGLRLRVAELEPLVAHATVDALIVAGLARAIARAPNHRSEAPVAGAVWVAEILDHCGKAGRAASGDYAECAHAAGCRIQAAVQQFALAKRQTS
ncbi:hypothetical protein [Methylobacterium brachiatum]|uniref:hypothetical protein n=1 Tax=Methylobacterium brachiatum TaxID=269660 RepID=UPI00244D6C5E|nr:hypothetical protein [Methylobacterium brachiatum]MDH2310806.1 hypothetical protein [Methylobacterium brachiatum]